MLIKGTGKVVVDGNKIYREMDASEWFETRRDKRIDSGGSFGTYARLMRREGAVHQEFIVRRGI